MSEALGQAPPGEALKNQPARLMDRVNDPSVSRGEVLAGTGLREAAANHPVVFSADASQLCALAYAGMGIRSEENRLCSIGGLTLEEAVGRLRPVENQIRASIMDRDALRIREELLSIGLDDNAQEVIALLDANLTLEQVVRPSHYDADFLRSLEGFIPSRTDPPTGEGKLLVPSLGARCYVAPQNDYLDVEVVIPGHEESQERVVLPLHDQTIAWLDPQSVYGGSSEAMMSQVEVFGALARSTNMVCTHMTGPQHLPGFLTSETWGTTQFRGRDAAEHHMTGLNTETGQLGNPEAYAAILQAMQYGETRATAPVVNTNGRGSFVSSGYVEPASTDPIFMFDKEVIGQGRTIPNPSGVGIRGPLSFDDPSLIGVWVTPSYRTNLLHWIDGWSEEERERIFKGRDPRTLLVSTADQLPERYHVEDVAQS